MNDTTPDIRPFVAAVPDDAIDDLKTRLARTRWPDPETVSDWSQGVRSDNLRRLLQRWEHDYDWRDFESRLNAHPQFLTEIDGVDIHFVHVRSPHPGALPLILTHGWPSSVIDFLRLIGPLTDPVAHGGSADDAFDVVIPSLPGFGFSGKPAETGWTVDRIADAWVELMHRLGYRSWAAQGGDWGGAVTSALGEKRPDGLVGVHLNTPYAFPQTPPAPLAGQAARHGHARLLQRTARRVEPPAGYEAPDARLRAGRLTGRPGGVDLREVPVEDRQSRPRRRRDPGRRHARHDLAVLVHQHGRIVGADLLGVLTGDVDQS